MTRKNIISEITRHLNAGRKVLLTGPRGIGKTWLLQAVSREMPNTISIVANGSKKGTLLSIAQQLWQDDKLADFAYFVDWADIEKRLKKQTLPELTALVAPHLAGYTVLIDNLHSATERALSDIIAPLLTGQVIATADLSVPAQRRRLNTISSKFTAVEIGVLSVAEQTQLVWMVLDRQAVKYPEHAQTHILSAAQGNPGAIVDMAQQLGQGHVLSRQDIRNLANTYDSAEPVRVNLLIPMILITIVVLMAGRYIARSLDNATLVLLAGIGYALTHLIRPLIYALRD